MGNLAKAVEFSSSVYKFKPCPHESRMIRQTGQLTLEVVDDDPVYCAPETLSDSKYVPASDLWQLGIVMFLMHTGGLPFEEPGVY